MCMNGTAAQTEKTASAKGPKVAMSGLGHLLSVRRNVSTCSKNTVEWKAQVLKLTKQYLPHTVVKGLKVQGKLWESGGKWSLRREVQGASS